MFDASDYQKRIFAFVTDGRGDGIVNAVAGAGKTTTLVEAARLVRGDAMFCAFNKHIAESLGQKLRGTTMTAKTIHALGFACVAGVLGRTQVDDAKYTRLSREYVNQNIADFRRSKDDQPYEAVKTLTRLVNFARLTLTDPGNYDALCEMALHYGVECDDRFAKGVQTVLRDGERMAETTKVIDYTDMLWLPHKLSLRPRQVQWVFCDECQDLSAAQLDLVLKLRANGGRMLFVGDPFQSIQGFAGADSDSFWKIKTATNATELPLSICYRCPSSHLELARQIVPQIEARPNAPAGVVDHQNADALSQLVREGDLVLCRVTAPLITECIKLITKRVPARIRGRDVGKELAELVRTLGEVNLDYSMFPGSVTEWQRKQLDRLARQDAPESRTETVNDKAEALRACYDGFTQCRSTDDLAYEIEQLFSDDRASVWLSTIHRAKGLEEQRVFIVEPEKMGQRRKGQQDWEYQQELNLKYVALTRAKDVLCFLNGSGTTTTTQTQQAMFELVA